MRGTSNAPLILGVVGAILMIPAMLCAAACASCLTGLGAAAGSEIGLGATAGFSGIGTMILFTGLGPVVLGFVGGFMGKPKPTVSGILLIIAAVIAFINLISTAFTSLFCWGAVICFVIGGIMAFVQKKE